jgi:hypothetical protein
MPVHNHDKIFDHINREKIRVVLQFLGDACQYRISFSLRGMLF